MNRTEPVQPSVFFLGCTKKKLNIAVQLPKHSPTIVGVMGEKCVSNFLLSENR